MTALDRALSYAGVYDGLTNHGACAWICRSCGSYSYDGQGCQQYGESDEDYDHRRETPPDPFPHARNCVYVAAVAELAALRARAGVSIP